MYKYKTCLDCPYFYPEEGQLWLGICETDCWPHIFDDRKEASNCQYYPLNKEE